MKNKEQLVIATDPQLNKEMTERHLPQPIALLSRAERSRMFERAIVMLYRWYTAISQPKRAWNPDLSFAWNNLRTDMPKGVAQTITLNFATEQYVPDFVLKLLRHIRQSYGRSQYHIAWGAEEEKHSDLWKNALLYSQTQTWKENQAYGEDLRKMEWELPFDDIDEMLAYTTLQERATMLNYANLGKIAKGLSKHPELAGFSDPVLEQVCLTIMKDEAAHTDFFTTAFRLRLYLFPDESLEKFFRVAGHFDMPGKDIIPHYIRHAAIVRRYGIYSAHTYLQDVVNVALRQLNIEEVHNLEQGLNQLRTVPHPDYGFIQSAIPHALNSAEVRRKTQHTLRELNSFMQHATINLVEPAFEWPDPTPPAYPVKTG